MIKHTGISYIEKDTPLHKLTGGAKLLMLLFISVSAMITFDTRLLIVLAIVSCSLFAIAKMPIKDMKTIFIIMVLVMIINTVITYLFSPEEGVAIYGTRTVVAHLFGPFYLTKEQLFFQLNMTIKYFAILPLAMLFFVTTEPSEFASSLNKIGVNYKIAYAVSLSLRYIPTVLREYNDISQSQQARGVDISKNVKITTRLKNIISILFPLVVTSIDKIDRISNAMELRSFGMNKKRTWYRNRNFVFADYFVIVISGLFIVLALWLNIVNGSRFFNPFV